MKNDSIIGDSHAQLRGHADRYPERRWQRRVAFWLLLAIAAFYLITEHRAHLALGLPYLPYLLLAACPLLHMFGHGGHGGHRHSKQQQSGGNSPPPDDTRSNTSERNANGTHRHGEDLP